MLKALFGMLGKLFLGIGMLGLALFGIVVVVIIGSLFFADKILKLIF